MAKVPDGVTVLTTLNMLALLAAHSPAVTNVPAFIAGLYPGHA
jgi:hypothetical protein